MSEGTARRVFTRVLALAVAAGLVLGAIWVRDRIDDGTNGGTDSGANGSQNRGATAPPPAEGLRVVCAPELRPVCDALDGTDGVASTRVEEAGVTADALAAADGEAGVEAWVTVRPWGDVLADRRQRQGRPPTTATAVAGFAHSDVVTVAWRDRLAVLEQRCDTLTWDCIGQVAAGTWADAGGQAAWGPVKPGHASPFTASGLPAAVHVAGARTGTVDFSLQQVQDPGFVDWFTGLERAVPDFDPSAGDHVAHMIQFGPSTFDVVATVRAPAERLIGSAGARAANLEVRALEPAVAVVVDVVAIGVDPGAVQGVLERAEAARALTELGWQTGDPAAPSPAAGPAQALQSTWDDVIR